MKTLVVYDSMYGTTEKLAREMGKTLKGSGLVMVESASEATAASLKGVTLLIIGCPTHGGRPTEIMQSFLDRISPRDLIGIKAACFDTRLDARKQNFALKILMSTIGYAAVKMGTILVDKGVKLATDPEGFIVEGKEGPVKESEIKRGKDWVRALAQ